MSEAMMFLMICMVILAGITALSIAMVGVFAISLGVRRIIDEWNDAKRRALKKSGS